MPQIVMPITCMRLQISICQISCYINILTINYFSHPEFIGTLSSCLQKFVNLRLCKWSYCEQSALNNKRIKMASSKADDNICSKRNIVIGGMALATIAAGCAYLFLKKQPDSRSDATTSNEPSKQKSSLAQDTKKTHESSTKKGSPAADNTISHRSPVQPSKGTNEATSNDRSTTVGKKVTPALTPKIMPQSAFGIRLKSGSEPIGQRDYECAARFISLREWCLPALCQPDDQDDPLLQESRYGEFMLSFDFHLTPEGPRLIEINHSADGIMAVSKLVDDPKALHSSVAHALRREHQAAAVCDASQAMLCCVIYSAAVNNARRMPEYIAFAEKMVAEGVPCRVASSEQVRQREGDGRLEITRTGEVVTLIYNKMDNDRRLRLPCHAHIRQAVLAGTVALTPHPAVYARSCDKRQLEAMQHSNIVLKSKPFRSRKPEEWWAERTQWVFKPPMGFASRGVKLGRTLTQQQMRAMVASDQETNWHVQQYAPATPSEDGVTRFDLRFYVHRETVLAAVTRNFDAEIMNLATPMSGLRHIRIVADDSDEGRAYADRVGAATQKLAEAVTGADNTAFVSTAALQQRAHEKSQYAAKERNLTLHNPRQQLELRLRRATSTLIKELRSQGSDRKMMKKAAQLSGKVRREILSGVKKGAVSTDLDVDAMERNFVERMHAGLGMHTNR